MDYVANKIKEVFPVISLFSGGGFLDLGFMNQGFQIEEALEINEKFIQGYNFALQKCGELSSNYYLRNKLVVHKNITKSTDVSEKENLRRLVSIYKGITGVIGGPPCQDYSVGGKNKGIHGERGKLILSYFQVIKVIKPDFLFFENVEGLYKTKAHQQGFIELIENIKGLGYSVWFDIINPLLYGFPQDRPRIIVVGFRNNIVEKLVRNGFKNESNNEVLRNDNSENYVFKWPKVLLENPKAIKWPSIWKFGSDIIQEDIARIPDNYKCLQVINVLGDLDESVPNQNEFFTPKSDKFFLIDEGATNRKSFKRLHRFRYSPTVAYGHNEVHLHPTEKRRLSVREALRLQTVPDFYILPKDISLTAKFQMISNAVPSAQAELIAKEIRRTLLNYYEIKN